MSNDNTKTRMMLKQDESAHDYCIPVCMEDEFDELLYSKDEDADVVFETVFDKMRLRKSITCYTFENFKDDN